LTVDEKADIVISRNASSLYMGGYNTLKGEMAVNKL